MAKRSKQVSHDSSDDEAPEAVSFGTSKKSAKGERDALQQHHAAQKQKQKQKNRAVDRALKDRSANTKGKGKGKGVGAGDGKRPKEVGAEAEAALSDDEESGLDGAGEGAQGGRSREELEERMARAMMEAEGESGSEDDEDEFAGFGDDVEMDGEDEGMSQEEDASGDEDEDEDEDEELLDGEQSNGDEDEDEEMGSGDEEEEEDIPATRPSSALRKDGYLPDHLFKSALSNAGKKIVFDDDDVPPSPEAPIPRKRKRTKRTSKDILLGSRTIRTLSKPSAVTSPAVAKGLVPPRRVDKFVKTSLNLKGDVIKAKSKGWNRQPANLGVMKRQGPAAHFVRAS